MNRLPAVEKLSPNFCAATMQQKFFGARRSFGKAFIAGCSDKIGRTEAELLMGWSKA